MGPLGWQETLVIFLLALLIFGPKKLPELGRNIGKAITEFRRASSELKATFDREMRSLEQESQSLQEITRSYDNSGYDYNYDSSYYDSGRDSYGSTEYGGSDYNASSAEPAAPAAQASTDGVSAPEGAESEPGVIGSEPLELAAGPEPPVAEEESGDAVPLRPASDPPAGNA